MSGLFSSIGGLFGSLIGDGFANREEEEEKKLYMDQLEEYGAIDPNAVRELKAEQSGRSEMDGVRSDPRMRDSQMRALNGMEGMYGNGGMDASAQAQMYDINNNVAQQDKARRDAIVQSQARKGRGTGGAAFSSLLSGAQGAAQAQAGASQQAHAAAQQRALQAMQMGGNMAGDMRGQDFGEQAAKAGANDKISQFNTQLRQQANIQNQQRDQQVVQNNFGKADRKGDTRKDLAGFRQRKASGHRAKGYGWGSSAGGIMDSVGGMGGG